MNILERSVMNYTDTQYNIYGDKVKELQQSINVDLKEYKDTNDKSIRLDSLSSTCDILINKAKEDKEKNIISKIVNLIRFFVIVIALYSAFVKISDEMVSGSLSSNGINNIIIYLLVCIVTIVIVSVLAKGTIDIIKNIYDEKITQISLKKAVIEANYKQLSKQADLIPIKKDDSTKKEEKQIKNK